ncbi:MAG: hypothetical protein RL328_663 [Acidobacteriota bacterium]|jgi:hypothetical protein
MQRVTLKTSTIFIGKGERTHVFHSFQEVPQHLRKELEDSTNGFNSATILIADRRGREEIRRALNGLPTALRTRLAPSLNPPAEEAPEQRPVEEPHMQQPEPFWIRRYSWMLLGASSLIAGGLWYYFR